MRMLNESCKCLEEGVIDSPTLGDLAAIYGVGFPAHMGGPFTYIDKVSPLHVVSELWKCHEFRKIPAFQPCNLLLDMAKKQSKFYS
ncbi:hypothetical protein MXB_203 [Myxobolus squamalis]|nr:hypothetical protein MXB_203 [Myxobolus squamalis]